MNTPHKSILAINRNLRKAIAELGRLSDMLSPAQVPGSQVESPVPTSRTKRKYVRRTNPGEMLKLKTVEVRLPNESHNRIAGLTKKIKTRKVEHLTQDQKDDIVKLLQTTLTVAQIATLFRKTRAAIYGIRDRYNVPTHKGSPALMAGIARLKKSRETPVQVPVPVSIPSEPELVGAH